MMYFIDTRGTTMSEETEISLLFTLRMIMWFIAFGDGMLLTITLKMH